MFVENGHKRTFLEVLVKDYNTKNKNNHNRNDTNRKKIHGYLILDQKLGKNLKR